MPLRSRARRPHEVAGPSAFRPPAGLWFGKAREVLLDAARRYRAVVTYKELAAQVQERSGVHTKMLMMHVPPDGGSPALTEAVERKRDWQRREAA